MTERHGAGLALDEPMTRNGSRTAQHRLVRDRPDETADRYALHRGFKVGAAFFGWLVAVALTVMLAGILATATAATGWTLNVSQSWIEERAGSIGIATGVTVQIVLMVAYYAGGYVAGRLARFDGARQGFGVWVLGLLMTLLAGGVSAVLASEYDVVGRIDLPSVSVPVDTLTTGGQIAAAAVIAGTALAAVVGSKAGQRYHTRIDSTD